MLEYCGLKNLYSLHIGKIAFILIIPQQVKMTIVSCENSNNDINHTNLHHHQNAAV